MNIAEFSKSQIKPRPQHTVFHHIVKDEDENLVKEILSLFVEHSTSKNMLMSSVCWESAQATWTL